MGANSRASKQALQSLQDLRRKEQLSRVSDHSAPRLARAPPAPRCLPSRPPTLLWLVGHHKRRAMVLLPPPRQPRPNHPCTFRSCRFTSFFCSSKGSPVHFCNLSILARTCGTASAGLEAMSRRAQHSVCAHARALHSVPCTRKSRASGAGCRTSDSRRASSSWRRRAALMPSSAPPFFPGTDTIL